jgi:hypothetical protein
MVEFRSVQSSVHQLSQGSVLRFRPSSPRWVLGFPRFGKCQVLECDQDEVLLDVGGRLAGEAG